MNLIMGIDPGSNGGIVLRGEHSLVCYVMPETPQKVDSLIKSYHPDVVIIEQSTFSPPSANKGKGFVFGHTLAHKIGKNYGILIGICLANGITPIEMVPKAWQSKMLGKVAKGETKKQAEILAKKLWPDSGFLASSRCRKPHDGMIDAALLTEYYLKWVEK